MARLVLEIRLHEGRYYGVPEWPPAPARVFQALVAGVARANRFTAEEQGALEWLESLAPPIVAAPPVREGQRVELFVPNNDADALGGDLERVGEIRTKKVVAPRLIEGDPSFLYAWTTDEAPAAFAALEAVAAQLYQLGRGLDMAWAVARLTSDAELDEHLRRHRGVVFRPGGTGAVGLSCPTSGSLASLVRRFDENSRRLRPGDEGRQLFVQPSKPYFQQVGYAARTERQVFELCHNGKVFAWRLDQVSQLVTRLRDAAAERLRRALPELKMAIEQVLIGRKADGSDAAPTEWRVRILALPSIGHEHADRALRRVVVEVPPGGPLAPADVGWAFSGLELGDIVLLPTTHDVMLDRFSVRARRWRTITAAALPEAAGRRRIDPGQRQQEVKDATERTDEEVRAGRAVADALRHAGVPARLVHVQVQREPFDVRGSRAEAFADLQRFRKERLWHLELELDRPIEGPLVLGDGRFLGLGLLAPEFDDDGVVAFEIKEGLASDPDPTALARSFRRAVMARVQALLGDQALPPFFSGHEAGGTPAVSERASHLAFHYEGSTTRRRLLILAPHLLERREATRAEIEQLTLMRRALDGLALLRAGRAGLLKLCASSLRLASDPLFADSRRWVSRTPYLVHRHAKQGSPGDAIAVDIVADCARRQLPRPAVKVRNTRGVAGRGLEGSLELEFPEPLRGPLVLGRSRYLGGGLFAAD